MTASPSPAIVRLRGRFLEEFPGSRWRWLAAPAACGYGAAVAARNAAFDWSLRRVRRLGVPVISIGNLTAGGTGKTPVTRMIAQMCVGLGATPAVLSRGYRGSDGANDEAQLMGGIPVHCDADRAAAGMRAIAAGATCLLLDDGFQHRQLHRDLDIVLVDATRSWGGLLPCGYQREPRRALARAQVLWLTRGDLVAPERAQAVADQLIRFGAPVLRDHVAQVRLTRLGDSHEQPPETLAGTAVVLASGLGNPRGFEATALRLGWNIVSSLRFPDHHHFDRGDLATIRAAAARAGAQVVITAKDAVKIAGLATIGDPLPPWWVLLSDHELADADRARLLGLIGALLRPAT